MNSEKFYLRLVDLIRQQEQKQKVLDEENRQIAAEIDAVLDMMDALQLRIEKLQEMRRQMASSHVEIEQDMTQQVVDVLATILQESEENLTRCWDNGCDAQQMEMPYLFFYDIESNQLGLVLPLPTMDADSTPQYAGTIIAGILVASLSLPENVWEKVDIGEWNDFTAITGNAGDFDEETLFRAVSDAITQQFAESDITDWLIPSPIPISKTIWSDGWIASETDDATEMAGEQSADSSSPSTVSELVPASQEKADGSTTGMEDDWDVGEGWYQKRDVQSWRRPLKITATSEWSREARMIRTMFIRMIAKGFVDGHYTLQENLWSGLPYEESKKMQIFVERLIKQEALLVKSEGDSTLVSVNPQFLDEIQTLISRTIDDFWKEIIYEFEPTA